MELVINKYHTFSEGSPITLNLASDTQTYWLSGSATLSSGFTVTVSGTPVDGMTLVLYYDGTSLTAGAGIYVTVLGIALGSSTGGKTYTPPTPTVYYPYMTKKLMFVSKYKASTATWETRMYIDTTMTNWVGPGDIGDNLVDDVTTEIDSTVGIQIKADGITNTHIKTSAAIAYTKLALTDSIVNADIKTSAAIAYSKLSLTNSILNADINASAAIAYTKLALTDSIVNADIKTTAAITYSKLVLTNSVVNADIATGAAITYAKLSLTGSILNADINTSAAIAYSKLALTNSILNADINSSAAIVYSKLSLTGSILNADINASAAIAYSKLALTGSILNADIASAAAVAWTKMAALTASRVAVISAAGVIEAAAAVTPIELGYLSGVTSNIQTQLANKGGGGGAYTKSTTATIVLDATATSYYILDCTSNAISITLPNASLFTLGSSITVLRKFTGGAFNITVSAFAGQSIDGPSAGPAGSYVMSGTTGETKTFLSNGVDQWVVAKA